MKISHIVGTLGLSATVIVTPAPSADGAEGGVAATGEPNLIAFVGRRLSVHHVEHKGKEVVFNAEYRVRAEVLQLVYGKYSGREMEFSSYVHIGDPPFAKNEFGVVYVSRHEGRFVQQQYLFQPAYPTRNGRWASCGDPYMGIPDMHRHGVTAEPITFNPPVTFDVRKGAKAQGFPTFRAPFFRIENNLVICLMGNYPAELFRVMAEGYLRARGVLGAVPE